MDSRRLPRGNRIKGRDRIYLDDYVDQTAFDADTVIGSVGDTVKILKNYKTPSHELDFKGDVSTRGRHGGRRQLQPLAIEDYSQISGRSEKPARREDTTELSVPAITDFAPTEEIRMMYGFSNEDVATIYISALYLSKRGIEIDPATDYFGVFGKVYKIRSVDQHTGFLDQTQVLMYIARKDL